jgi:hypothetical protein
MDQLNLARRKTKMLVRQLIEKLSACDQGARIAVPVAENRLAEVVDLNEGVAIVGSDPAHTLNRLLRDKETYPFTTPVVVLRVEP